MQIPPSFLRNGLPLTAWMVIFLLVPNCAQPSPQNTQANAYRAELAASPARSANAISWPPDVDAAVPPVVTGTACPLSEVLRGAGTRMTNLITELQAFTATERVEYTQIGKSGKSEKPKMKSFEYLVSLSEVGPGMLSVEETRNRSTGVDVFPGPIADLGLPAVALIFHPYYAGEYEFRCEGLGQWRERSVWQVYFRQRPEKPARIRSYSIRHISHSVKLKGRAWIDPTSYQVLALETSLLEPVPAIRLRSEFLSVEYQPVRFHSRDVELWLPKNAEMFAEFQGRRYHLRHSFANYLLFSVDTAVQLGDLRQQ